MIELTYTPWKMSLFCQKPHSGSRRFYGNFMLGVCIDSHPQFFNFTVCLLVIEIGLSFMREAVVREAACQK